MKKYERSIIKDRKRQYKRLKKLIKARDAASKYFNGPLKTSSLVRTAAIQHTEFMSISQLAVYLVRERKNIQRQYPAPPLRKN